MPTLDKRHFKTPGYKKIVEHDTQSHADKIIRSYNTDQKSEMGKTEMVRTEVKPKIKNPISR